MKIKFDFITNSSSTSYCIIVPRSFKKMNLFELKNNHLIRSCRVFLNKKQFIKYIQDGLYDWIDEIRGPKYFNNMSRENYIKIKSILEDLKDKKILFISLQRSMETEEFFKSLKKFIKDNNMKILEIQE